MTRLGVARLCFLRKRYTSLSVGLSGFGTVRYVLLREVHNDED